MISPEPHGHNPATDSRQYQRNDRNGPSEPAGGTRKGVSWQLGTKFRQLLRGCLRQRKGMCLHDLRYILVEENQSSRC